MNPTIHVHMHIACISYVLEKVKLYSDCMPFQVFGIAFVLSTWTHVLLSDVILWVATSALAFRQPFLLCCSVALFVHKLAFAMFPLLLLLQLDHAVSVFYQRLVDYHYPEHCSSFSFLLGVPASAFSKPLRWSTVHCLILISKRSGRHLPPSVPTTAIRWSNVELVRLFILNLVIFPKGSGIAGEFIPPPHSIWTRPGDCISPGVTSDPWPISAWRQNWTGVGPILTPAGEVATGVRHTSNPIARYMHVVDTLGTTCVRCCPTVLDQSI